MPTPIPVIPSLVGAVTYKQAASYWPGGPALGDWVLSNGVEYLLGSILMILGIVVRRFRP